MELAAGMAGRKSGLRARRRAVTERELFQRIATQWVVLAVHKEGMEQGRTSRPEQ
jgi:hypothetical protein